MATPSGRAPAERVRVTMSAPSLRYHVALVDYLPAGFETLNPELAITEAVPEDRKETSGSHWWLWRRVWFDYLGDLIDDLRPNLITSQPSAPAHRL